MAYVPDMRKALDEFSELVAYGRKSPDVGEALSEFLYGGSPPFRADIDFAVAETAPDAKVVYQLVDGLHVLLAACRARNFKPNHIPEGVSHG